MRQFFFPTQDVSLYEEFPNRQTGLDEILEVGKSDEGTYSKRSLILFDIAAISSSMLNRTLPLSASFDLKLFVSRAEKLVYSQSVNIYPVSQSWKEGTGYFYHDSFEDTDGATWVYKETGSRWATSGSSFISSTSSSVIVGNPIVDFQFDVTSIVRSWLSGTFPNYGLVAKFPTIDESNPANEGSVWFFSRNTHTVFLPTLIAKWDDSSRATGSMSASSDTNLSVYPTNLKPLYRQGEIVRVDVLARSTYPLKTTATVFTGWQDSYLPTSSYYSIEDVQSKEVIIPFDDYSKLSVDSNGNFFKFRVEKMYPRRYYKVLFKVVTSTGYQHVIDDNYTFSIKN